MLSFRAKHGRRDRSRCCLWAVSIGLPCEHVFWDIMDGENINFKSYFIPRWFVDRGSYYDYMNSSVHNHVLYDENEGPYDFDTTSDQECTELEASRETTGNMAKYTNTMIRVEDIDKHMRSSMAGSSCNTNKETKFKSLLLLTTKISSILSNSDWTVDYCTTYLIGIIDSLELNTRGISSIESIQGADGFDIIEKKYIRNLLDVGIEKNTKPKGRPRSAAGS